MAIVNLFAPAGRMIETPPRTLATARRAANYPQPAALVLAPLILLLSCASSHRAAAGNPAGNPAGKHDDRPPQPAADTASHAGGAPDRPAGAPDRPASARLIRVVVALCDNLHQGIVPVPARIGNGDDPESNLYWGAGFGVKTFLARSPDWRMLGQIDNPGTGVLRRCIFRHKDREVYLVADAYQGIEIKRAITEFLDYAAGASPGPVALPGGSTIDGAANLIAYVGHDGLMDFSLPRYPEKRDGNDRDVMVLCCASKSYFSDAIRASGARPLLLTTGLMAPEAYILEAAIKGWISGESGDQIRNRAAVAYNTYQRCGLRAARNLFTTGY